MVRLLYKYVADIDLRILLQSVIYVQHYLFKEYSLCLLNEYRASFITFSLQFGFKQGLSADLCTGLIKNVIARYCNNNNR